MGVAMAWFWGWFNAEKSAYLYKHDDIRQTRPHHVIVVGVFVYPTRMNGSTQTMFYKDSILIENTRTWGEHDFSQATLREILHFQNQRALQ